MHAAGSGSLVATFGMKRLTDGKTFGDWEEDGG